MQQNHLQGTAIHGVYGEDVLRGEETKQDHGRKSRLYLSSETEYEKEEYFTSSLGSSFSFTLPETVP